MSGLICYQSDPMWADIRGCYRWTSTGVRDALGLAYRPDETLSGKVRMALGTAAEAAIRDTWLAELRSGGEVYDLEPAALYQHPTEPAWASTTDGILTYQGIRWVLEIKNRASGAKYQEPGVNDLAEKIQCLWHLACVPDAAGCIRLAWTGYDLHEDVIHRCDSEADIAALERRVRDLSSDDPAVRWAATLATEQALQAMRGSRATWEPAPDGLDCPIDRYLTAKQAVKLAEDDQRRAEHALILASGNAEKLVSERYYYSRPFRSDGARGPVSIKPRVTYEW